MPQKNISAAFWDALDSLVRDSELVVDRPKASHHPRFPQIVFPVDYGYLKNTASMDGNGIDVWRGSDSSVKIDAVVCTIDLQKKDSEVKILIGCTSAEMKLIYEFHNQNETMKGLLIER
jgi:inorganic pyrophosphatase